MKRSSRSTESDEPSVWIKYWAGPWSLYTCSHFGEQYYRLLKKVLGCQLSRAIFIIKKGYATAYLEKADRARFGNALVEKTGKKTDYSETVAKNLNQSADHILSFLQTTRNKPADVTLFQRFLELFYEYVPWHLAVKNMVDYMPYESLEKYLPALSKARVRAEPVFRETEIFTEKFAETLCRQAGLSKNLILCMTKKEMEKYLKAGQLPRTKKLKDRQKHAVLFFKNGKFRLLVGKKAEAFEKALLKSMIRKSVQGVCAHPGTVEGIVRIVLDPATCKKFNPGDILVAEMTRPEFLPLIRKAGAVVTDAGGILCHAAIVARELKKPTVIGTQVATKTFKDKEYVMVNASNGTVRKIEPKNGG